MAPAARLGLSWRREKMGGPDWEESMSGEMIAILAVGVVFGRGDPDQHPWAAAEHDTPRPRRGRAPQYLCRELV